MLKETRISYVYDTQGRVTKSIMSSGASHEWVYDDAGRVVEEILTEVVEEKKGNVNKKPM
jgi:YD repeat-containing protein